MIQVLVRGGTCAVGLTVEGTHVNMEKQTVKYSVTIGTKQIELTFTNPIQLNNSKEITKCFPQVYSIHHTQSNTVCTRKGTPQYILKSQYVWQRSFTQTHTTATWLEEISYLNIHHNCSSDQVPLMIAGQMNMVVAGWVVGWLDVVKPDRLHRDGLFR